MLIEMVQASLAIILLAMGVWLYSMTKPARPRKVVQLAAPSPMRWRTTLVTLAISIVGKRGQIPS